MKVEIDWALAVKFLRAIKEGIYDSGDFPELKNATETIEVEIIDQLEQVRRED